MRQTFRLIAVLAVFVPVVSFAGEKASTTEAEKESADQGVYHDACFGDRYESDADLNEGNTVTVDEILALINPPRS